METGNYSKFHFSHLYHYYHLYNILSEEETIPYGFQHTPMSKLLKVPASQKVRALKHWVIINVIIYKYYTLFHYTVSESWLCNIYYNLIYN